MNVQELSGMSDEALIALCVAPAIRAARGKDPETKAHIMTRLSSGQRALFMFQVLYGHAGLGIGPFFQQISYLTETLDIWSALKSSMKYFNDAEMLALVEKMKIAFDAATAPEESAASLAELDALYSALIPKTVRRIGSHIRNHPADFTALEN